MSRWFDGILRGWRRGRKNQERRYASDEAALAMRQQAVSVPAPYLEKVLNEAPRNEFGDLTSVQTLHDLMGRHHLDEDGRLLVPERIRNWIAVIDLREPDAAVIIVCTRQFSGSPEYHSFRALLQLDQRYVLVRTLLCEAGAILASYSANSWESENDHRVTQINSQSGALFIDIVRTALSLNGVTDIHLEVKDEGYIRHRIDGRLIAHGASFPAQALISVCGYAYTQLASANSRSSSVFSRTTPQSCLIELNLDGAPVRLRYQHTPLDNNGMKCVLRILPVQKYLGGQTHLLTLEELGYTPSQVRLIQLATKTAFGAFILAGVTGSGKSTTIKSVLETDPNRDSLVTYTVEDPVEYTIQGVAQIPIQRARAGRAVQQESRGNTYAEVIVALLRMDPDRIVPGEIRERETAKSVETAVLTGHQVLTTVHASSALSIVDRLSSDEIGLSRQTLGLEGFLSGLLYQRLMPKNCPHCALDSVDVLPAALLQLIEQKYAIDPKRFKSRNPQGCSQCYNGIRGQKVAAEIILPAQNLDFLRFIRDGNDAEAREVWRSSRRTPYDDPDMSGKSAMEHSVYDMSLGLIDPAVIEESFVPFELAHVWPIRGN